jgi:hypothetical protein
MIAYDNEKLILTQDDNLPMLEIDDHYQLTTLQNDMQFLIKISMNWDEIKSLKKEMEQSIYTSNLHFRYQLLKVTCNMKVTCCQETKNIVILIFILVVIVLEFDGIWRTWSCI